ncbi:hypothetical protein THASP1DRAFT_35421 [Thamnocephalis sphaerospora]|uniref:Uncharacterized protein n=1 Tax=Thamnocephalis sphaerospora TaxID=78915 RepID=A0A4P9XI43_9FUNG|nr:hypothetical protein THASP1DRAFT_35421 [Thamnocephalis sphaerospora]|eukprot:RKP05001.1 hypothetical protein THASP1DRAFT_35421 [Thamnocephalis sphaerospora]
MAVENVLLLQREHATRQLEAQTLVGLSVATETERTAQSVGLSLDSAAGLRRDSDSSLLSCISAASLASTFSTASSQGSSESPTVDVPLPDSAQVAAVPCAPTTSSGSTATITERTLGVNVHPSAHYGESSDEDAQPTPRQIHWAHPLPTSAEAGQNAKARKRSTTPPRRDALPINAGDFESEQHFYPRVLNASIHPLVSSFFNLGNERMLHRYTHLNPSVDAVVLRRALAYQPKHFMWGGADLFNVTTASGKRQMIVVETNSCPSGQKSMPLLHEVDELGGYGTVLRTAFRHLMKAGEEHEEHDELDGDLAVIYDKNHMEASGYAAAMAEIYGERVWLVEYTESDNDPPLRWTEDVVMEVRDKEGDWHPIRACFRYVTQRPWARIPVRTRTRILNGTLACLAGGRNKQMAARAYEFLNAELAGTGLQVRMPETKRNVSLEEVPLLVKSFGGHAVLKVPYSNAGQGVFTITNQEELDTFMRLPHKYEKFIVQSLVGNASWSSQTMAGRFYHVGTVPNRKNHTFVSDLRVMVAGDESGFRPIAIYGRRARRPLLRKLDDDPEVTSWEMLGTNLSVKNADGSWTTESSRLMLMDRKDFNQLGVGLDDLIDAYVQTILSVTAIDMMCQRLLRPHDGEFDYELFRALNPDEVLLSEIQR